ncbi:DUF1885 family protein [Desmospora activa]|uniref:Uncharacterized protein DUF1885 n=1 Tax=Desmospora activa DSM 45169 TaxID=1121389 RepID=A0A2T4ZBN8_9BACL|nr:DUF1885 family protein [Desmospora activa]PTM59303.1 uncharacterized protein DUF1885 [Desmospora activa DSM 45169]
MGKSAWIYLVEGSTQQKVSLDDIEAAFNRYMEMTSHTGEQLGWKYADAAFPYTVAQKDENGTSFLLLTGRDTPLYKHLLVGVGQTQANGKDRHHIQLVLPTGSTHGDMAKANEFCRYLAKTFQGELHLFNGRVMYFYPRKL